MMAVIGLLQFLRVARPTRHHPCTMTKSRFVLPLAAALVSAPGGALFAQARDSTLTGFPALASEFVFTSLAFSPASATQAGLHDWTDPYTGKRAHLDSLLDNFSPQAIEKQRAYFMRVQSRLAAIDRAHLDAQTQADYDVVANAAAFALFGITKERFHQFKPQMYAEDLGNSLFANISLEYADKNTRAADLTARVARVPDFLAVARRNLRAANEIYTRVALEETDGVSALVKDMGADFTRGTPSQARYARVAPAALAALAEYQRFVKDTLSKRGTVDWRSGVGLFNAKWKYSLAVSLTPDEALRIAEDSMRKTRAEMLVLARPLHDKWFPGHKHTGDSTAVLNAIVSETLARIGAEHANRDSLLQQAKTDVAALTRVVRDQRIVSLDSFPNLQVIPTPEFMRGVYGVAGAVFAPPLNPDLATFYWVTPIPAAWTGRARRLEAARVQHVQDARPHHARRNSRTRRAGRVRESAHARLATAAARHLLQHTVRRGLGGVRRARDDVRRARGRRRSREDEAHRPEGNAAHLHQRDHRHPPAHPLDARRLSGCVHDARRISGAAGSGGEAAARAARLRAAQCVLRGRRGVDAAAAGRAEARRQELQPVPLPRHRAALWCASSARDSTPVHGRRRSNGEGAAIADAGPRALRTDDRER